jgi:hypothetical protein
MRNPELHDDPSSSHELRGPLPDLGKGQDTREKSAVSDLWLGMAVIGASLVVSIAWFAMLGWGALRILRWLIGL